MIKTSEFSTIAVLVAATAVIVAVQQYRERERRPIEPPTIEAQPLAPATGVRRDAPTEADLVVTSQPVSHAPGGP